MEFKVIKLDRKRNNVVVSRRAVLEASQGEERRSCCRPCPRARCEGIVKNITDYGAFVTWAASTAAAHHRSRWRRVKHPSEVLNVGDEVTAKILKFDQEKNRVSLGMKQLAKTRGGPVAPLPDQHAPVRQSHQSHDYGAFVEVEQGIEGLVHVSEMDWTNKNVHPSKWCSSATKSR